MADIDELPNLNQEESDLAALLVAGPNQEGRDHIITETETLLRTIDALRAQVARLEERNAALEAALRYHAEGCHQSADLDNALSDTGQGWLPPEVEGVASRLRSASRICHSEHIHAGPWGECNHLQCCQDRAALERLEEK